MTAVDTFGLVGTVIAEKYRVDRVVDEGGFSLVYKAEHLIWREPVALKCFKVLATAAADQRDQLLDAFIQEGKLMTSLSSRSAAIVQARDIGKLTTADGQWIPYIVMEWLDGKPLDVVLYEEAKRGLPPRTIIETIALLESAAVAFETCHARSIAHRDIKPGNLIVIGDPRGPTPFVKVLDFGIAKVMAEHAAQTTASAHTGKEITAFTPNYGAPEQFSRTHGATGPWTDVFAMALICVEVLRGGHPALDGDDFLQLGMASRDPMRRPTPRAFGVPVSDAVESVFQRALAVDPEHRFKTMGQFWTALHHAVFPDAGTWTGTAGILQRASYAGAPPGAPFMPPGAGSGPYPAMPSGGYPGMAPSPGSVPYPGMAPSGHPSYPGAPPSFNPRPPSIPGAGPPTGNLPYPGAPPSMQPVPGAPTTPPYAGAPQYGAPAATPYSGTPAVEFQPLARPSSAGGPPQVLTAAPATYPSPEPPAGRRGLVAAAAAAVMVGAAIGAFLLLGSKPGGSGVAGTGAGSATSTAAGPTSTAMLPATSTATSEARLTECPANMVLVPGGKFFMGSDEPTFKLWQPAHKVQLDTFCIDLHEVTVSEYKTCSDQGECKRPLPIPSYPKSEGSSDADYEKTRAALAELCNFGKEGREKHPVNCVTWEMANSYCQVQKARLPTEAEWEFAARGSDGRTYPWGDDPAREKHMNACGKECNAWEKAHGLKLTPPMYAADDGYPGTAPVGSFPEGKTRFGNLDMVGNVWEWTADYFEIYKPDEVLNPKGPSKGDRRAIRGGAFNGGVALWLNPAFRYHQVEDAAAPALGFRCARSL